MILRDYQSQGIDETRKAMRAGFRSVLLVYPCGSGKTVMFSSYAAGAVAKNNRVLILCHRHELIDQISRTLNAFHVKHSFIAKDREYNPLPLVHVASVFTAVRREIQEPQVIIIDEAHHAISGSTWDQILNRFPKAYRIGVTASPVRLSGEPLGDIFEFMIQGPSIEQLTAGGHLTPCRVYAPSTIPTHGIHMRGGDFARTELAIAANRPTITGSAVSHYERLAAGKRAIVYCCSIEHASRVASEFESAGHSSEHINGGMLRETRQSVVDAFRAGRITVLTSCDLISEGFDLPAIEVGIMLRPTASLGLWLQQTGRVLRPYPGKTQAIILDHAGNTLRHGMPDDTHDWSLFTGAKPSRGQRDGLSVRVCPWCFGAQPGGRAECRYCQAIFPVEARQVTERDGELTEIHRLEARRSARREQGQARSMDALVALGKKRNYDNPYGWAMRVLRARGGR